MTAAYWYDRHLRAWTLIWKDSAGNQSGDAEYFAGGDGKARLLKRVGPAVSEKL